MTAGAAVARLVLKYVTIPQITGLDFRTQPLALPLPGSYETRMLASEISVVPVKEVQHRLIVIVQHSAAGQGPALVHVRSVCEAPVCTDP